MIVARVRRSVAVPNWPPSANGKALSYLADTDSLYIELCDRPSVDSREISEGVVLEYDAEGRLVGIDVDNAGNKIELQKVLLSKLPGKVETEAA